MWSKCIVLILLILIWRRLPVDDTNVKMTGKHPSGSDENIDEILWEFMGKWEAKEHAISHFKTTMTDILRLFAGIDARKLGEMLFRIRIRLESITRVLREEKHSELARRTKKKTEI